MNSQSVADPLTSSIASTALPNAMANGQNGLISYNLDTRTVEKGPINQNQTLLYVGIAPYTDPSKQGWSLKIETDPNKVLSQGANKIYCIKGLVPTDGRNFIQAHNNTLVDLKARLVSLNSNTPQQQSTNLFGGNQMQQDPGMKMPPNAQAAQFGGATNQQPSMGFGSGMIGNQQSTGLFGQAQQLPQNPMVKQNTPSSQVNQGGLFGQSQQLPSNQQASQGGLFGQAQQPSQGGLFGQGQQLPPNQQPSQGGLFGQAQQPSQGGLFGQGQQLPPNQQASQGGLFGQAQQPSQGGLFGQAQQLPPNQQPSQGGLFGQGQQSSQGGLFGQAQQFPPNQQASQGGLFGQAQQVSFGQNQQYQQNSMFAQNPNQQMYMQVRNPRSIILDFWKKGGKTNHQMLIAIFKASCGYSKKTNSAGIGKIFADGDTDSKVYLNIQKPIVWGLRSLPHNRDEISQCISQSAGSNDPGVIYRIGASQKAIDDAIKSLGVHTVRKFENGMEIEKNVPYGLPDLIEALLELFVEEFSDKQTGQVSDQLIQSFGGQMMGGFQQNMTGGFQNQFNQQSNQTFQGGVFGAMNTQTQSQSNINGLFGQSNTAHAILPHPFSNQSSVTQQSSFNPVSQPVAPISQSIQLIPAKQSISNKKHINQYYEDLKSFDEYELFMKDIKCVIVNVKDGDTVDLGVMIPLRNLPQCKHVSKSGVVSNNPMCMLNGDSNSDEEIIQLLNIRFQGIDAAEYHIRESGEHMKTTREGWFAYLLIARLAELLHKEDAELLVDMHGLGMYSRHQGTLKLNGVDIGLALCDMEYNGRKVALAGYDGKHKSHFTEQFEKLPFKETTENPSEIEDMMKHVDVAFPLFMSKFGDYKKNVSGSIKNDDSVNSLTQSMNNISLPASSSGLFGQPSSQANQSLAPPSGLFGQPSSQVTQSLPPPSSGLFGNQNQSQLLPFGQAPKFNVLDTKSNSQNPQNQYNQSVIQPQVPIVTKNGNEDDDFSEVDDNEEETNIGKYNYEDGEPDADLYHNDDESD